MQGVNFAVLLGALGRDPEVRTTASGEKVARLNLATGKSWKDRTTGEKKEATEWHTVVIFGPLAEVAEKYLRKGSKAFVRGELRTRKWTDNNGVERYTTEVVLSGPDAQLTMLDGPKGDRAPPPGGPEDYGTTRTASPPPPAAAGAPFDDEIPF